MSRYTSEFKDLLVQLGVSFTVAIPAITVYSLVKREFSIESFISAAILFVIVTLFTTANFGLKKTVICITGGIAIGGVAGLTVLLASEIWLMYLAIAMWSYTTVLQLRSKETSIDSE